MALRAGRGDSGRAMSSPPSRLRRWQVDVVEKQHELLQQRLEASSDFEEVERAHAAFLAACTQQMFLDLRVVGKTWEAILQSALGLAALVRVRGQAPLL